MLRKETIENLKNVFLKQNENNPYVIHFLQIDQDFYSIQYEIGRFNFYTNEGYIVLPKIGKKEYKRFGSLMNAIFKIDEFFGWDASVVENAKKAAQNLKEEEKKQLELEYKEHQEQKAKNFIESINNNDEKTINIIKNKLMYKTEEEVKQIVINSFRNVSAKTINGVVNAIMNKINELNNPIETTSNNEKEKQETEETTNIKKNDPEVFHLYNNIFNSYCDAYDYAIRNQIPVTMILSSKHPFMTNERLKELEHSYVLDKIKMPYENMKEYFNYLSELPETLDKQNRYYKLKSWIERKEYQEKQKKEREQYLFELNRKADKQLRKMVSKGLEIKSNKSMVQYYINGKKVHQWFSGIPTEEYCKGIENIYNTYFNNQQTTV